jgi:hypothetical protein
VTVVDTTPPSISCPADATGTVGQVVALGRPGVSDAVDPHPAVANDAPSVFPPGTTAVTWSATDGSGNRSRCEQRVTLTYNFAGFFPPVSNADQHVAEAGATLVFKWSLKDASSQFVSDLRAVRSFGFGPTDTGAVFALQYDPTENQYFLSAKTPKAWAGRVVAFTLVLDDGTSHPATFRFKA